MKKFYQLSNTNQKIFFFIIPTVFFFIYVIFNGMQFSPDVHRNIKWLTELKNLNYNLFKFQEYIFQQRGVDGNQFILTIYLYAILDLLGGNLKVSFAITNYIFFLILLLYLYKFLKKDLEQNLYIFFPTILLFNHDFTMWSKFMLTDYVFSIIVIMFIICFANYNKNKFLFFFLLFILLLLRPTGIVIIFFILNYFILKKTKIYKNLFIIIFLIFLILLIISFVIYYELIPLFFMEKFQYFKIFYDQGVIIHHRPNLNLQEPNSMFGILKIMLVRFVYFFSYLNSDFSLKHNIYNLIYYTPIYAFAIYAIFNINNFTETVKNIIFLQILLIISFAIFHSITLIDYEWRYRLPCIIPLTLLAYYGMQFRFLSYLKK